MAGTNSKSEESSRSTLSVSTGALCADGEYLGNKVNDFVRPYKLLEVVGEGGFGVVWLAERREPFVQRVALKIIKPGMDSKSVLARFDQERQALAVMDHPNVARVLDGGLTSEAQGSRPYFVMEYVKGEPITKYCDRNRLTLRQRLELFISVCEAVQHAHHKGIIHRDIKPNNVLVTVVEGRLAAKVIDFGVAKAVSHTLTELTILTEHGQLIGTPEYMSPEQAEMGATDVDTRTDVYSLGVLLYELMSGQLPFDSVSLRAAALDEIRRIIREQEPPKPSTRLTTLDAPTAVEIARRRQAQREELTSALRRELDWIPLKAMRKDRARRYATPGDIAQDIQRHLDGKPIDAAPESRVYLLRKFAARNRGAIAAALVVVISLTSGVIVSMIAARRALIAAETAEAQTRIAEAARQEADRQRQLAEQRADEIVQQRTRAEKVAEFVDLFARAQSELSTIYGTRDSYNSLVRRLTDGELAESPVEDIAIRTALAVLAQGSYGGGGDKQILLEGALPVARAYYGPTHPTTTQILSSLASSLDSAQQYESAAARFQELVDVRRAEHEGDHPEIVDALINVAKARSNVTGADWKSVLDEAERMARRLWPKGDHPDSVAGLIELAGARSNVKGADSESVLVEAERMARRLWPDDDGKLDDALRSRVGFLRQRGRHDDADVLDLERVGFAASPQQPAADSAQEWLINIAEGFEERGKHEFAVRAWAGLLELRQRVLPQGAWRIANARSRFGGALFALGRLDEAEPHLIAGFEGLNASSETPRDAGSDRLREACDRLVQLYEKREALEPGKDHARLAANWKARLVEADAVRARHEMERAKGPGPESEAKSLNNAAFGVVGTAESAANAGAARVATALGEAVRADELDPRNWLYTNTLGVAQFRSGQYAECLETLLRAEQNAANMGWPPQLGNWAFIAMAQKRLGRDTDADAARAKYLELVDQPKQSGSDAEKLAWKAEVEAAFGK